MSDCIIETKGLTKRYGEQVSVSNLDLHVQMCIRDRERISINLGQGFRRKIHLEVKPVSQTAVEEIGSDLTEKSLQL